MIGLQLATPGDRMRADLDATRKKITDTREAIETTLHAPLQLDDAVERVMQDVRARAEHSENGLRHFASVDAFVPERDRPRSSLDTLALLFNVMPEIIERGLRAHLKPACSASALPLADRGAHVAKLRAKLAPLLVREEELIAALLLDGVVVERTVPESGDDVQRMLAAWERITS